MAMVCWAACRSQPIILISASFDPSAVDDGKPFLALNLGCCGVDLAEVVRGELD